MNLEASSMSHLQKKHFCQQKQTFKSMLTEFNTNQNAFCTFGILSVRIPVFLFFLLMLIACIHSCL